MAKRTFTKRVLEIFDVSVPDEKDPKLVKHYHFTTADRPVTHAGQQYIPLSAMDAAKWLVENKNET